MLNPLEASQVPDFVPEKQQMPPIIVDATHPSDHMEEHTIRHIMNPAHGAVDITGKSPHEHDYDADIPEMEIHTGDLTTYPLNTKDIHMMWKKLPRAREIKTLLQKLKASHLNSINLPVEYQSLKKKDI